MPKKMLINALHAEEARVAIVEDGRLVDLGIEIAGREQTRGNVYKGVVVRVEPGLQAAFIDIGLKKLGFLQMGELHSENWQWRDDVPPDNRNRRPRIQEVLRRGQEILVQVEKGERDMKGAALTTYLSLPGRYMVLMPGSDSAGVSRKVEVESERKKLKEMAAELNIPEGTGYIIRTEALGKKQVELAKDSQYLIKLYESIRDAAAKAKAPALIYQESDLIIRTIRDYFTAEIDEVLVDSVEVYEQARDFFREVMPRNVSRVKLHQEKRPIFSRYQLEEQIDQIYEKKVPLKSGGSLVIEPAEALVSIDVNSGKSTGEKGVEDTAFKTNLEAAEEAARQLRLRDLGGLIVIDFIDMRDRKHVAEVEKTLKHALKGDKARVTVGKISQFGLLEMSRQRIKQTVNEAVYLECPHCEGRGRIKSVEAMALSFLRKVHGAAAKGTIGEVRGGLPLEVAYYLLNRKKRDLAQIENDYDIEVTLKGKPSFLMNQLDLELVKREKPSTDSQPDSPPSALISARIFAAEPDEAEEEEALAVVTESAGDTDTAEGGKKRKRRRGKKKPEAEAASGAGESVDAGFEPTDDAGAGEAGEPHPEAEEPAQPGEMPESPGQESGAAPRKRKRRRKKGKSGAAGSPAAEAIADDGSRQEADETAAADTVMAEPVGSGTETASEGSPAAEEGKKKRRRRRRGGAKRHPEEGVSAETAMPPADSHPSAGASAPTVEPSVPAPAEAASRDEQAVSGGDTAQPLKKPRVPRPRKKSAGTQPEEAPVAAASFPATESVPEVPVAAPAKRKRVARKTGTGEALTVMAPELPALQEAAGEKAAAPSQRKRPVRKSAPADKEPVPAVTAQEEGGKAAPKRTRKKKAAGPAGEAGQE